MGIKVGTRYRLADKANFRKAIIAYKQVNEKATLREIAQAFGISHVRVWAILNSNSKK